jgi:hypothetical protein
LNLTVKSSLNKENVSKGNLNISLAKEMKNEAVSIVAPK